MYATFNNNKLTISCTNVHKKESVLKLFKYYVNISAGLSLYTEYTKFKC